MHTVISAFEDRASAQRAMDRLVASGVAREDVHIQHIASEASTGQGAIRERIHEQPEREVAVDRGTLDSIGRFFASLFGLDHQQSYAGTYTAAVQGGRAVLVVDARDEEEAERALDIMHAEGSTAKPDIVERPRQTRLRDIVLTTEDPLASTSTAMHDRVIEEVSSLAIEGQRQLRRDEKERAIAANSDAFRDKPSR
ncbi:MAG TPA: hypothetical protein VHA82_12875 [Ramlibacter sp.]|uniref:hypothetical protein n=1 Tax=Ramlibacter sp. TaxID=1917967 RepID=UPI002BC0C99F|nr:hypothetical protein [Ramlibacter sp.]HVZ44696.1 hypothetical protein [Ramlibacter sp.]